MRSSSLRWRLPSVLKTFARLHHMNNGRPQYAINAEKDQRAFIEFVRRYFGDIHSLSFVQIGANDGVMADPLHDFIDRYAWKGILIEPQRREFQKLKRTYRKNRLLKFENAAIAYRRGFMNLYKLQDDYIRSREETGATFQELTGIASLSRKHSELGQEWVDKHSIVAEKVATITFSDLLEKYRIAEMDVLQIDTEGYDGKILRQINFKAVSPKVIHFEHKFLSETEKEQCDQLLRSAGYVLEELTYDVIASLERR